MVVCLTPPGQGEADNPALVGHPLTDEPGQLRFVGAVMDITARKTSENALRNSGSFFSTCRSFLTSEREQAG